MYDMPKVLLTFECPKCGATGTAVEYPGYSTMMNCGNCVETITRPVRLRVIKMEELPEPYEMPETLAFMREGYDS